MKITPLDIQQMFFRVKLRGYDQEEVNRFCGVLAREVLENLSQSLLGF